MPDEIMTGFLIFESFSNSHKLFNSPDGTLIASGSSFNKSSRDFSLKTEHI